MKRLTGWDAFLLYSETPNVHMHTLKIAVVELVDMGGRSFGIDEFRQVIHSRLYKLHPLRYELVDIPFKFHHPMWRENCQVDLGYHVRPWTLPAPGGRRELDDAIGEIASTPLDRSRPLWEMYFVDGLANGRIAVVNKIHHALADGVAAANLLALGMDLTSEPDTDRDYDTDPAPTRGQLVRTAFRDHVRQIGTVPATVRYTAAGHQPGAAQFAQALTGTDAPVHATAELHEPCAEAAAPVRHRDAVAGRHQGDQEPPRRLHQRPGAGHVGGCTAKVVAAL